jgi:elongation factor Ts
MRKQGLTKADKRAEREAREGVIGTYNHDNRIGVLVEVNCETAFVARNEMFTSMVKDIAMHIAATNPEYLDEASVPDDVRDKMRQEFTVKAQEGGKPANIVDQIVDGMMKKYYAEYCLMNQPFVKNPDQTVGNYVKEHIAKLGENIIVRRYERMALGEVN